MIDLDEVANAIDRIQAGETNWTAIEHLAALYTVKNNLDVQDAAQSRSPGPDDISSEFGEAIRNKPIRDVLEIIDELMDALQVTQPRLYNSVIRKIQAIE